MLHFQASVREAVRMSTSPWNTHVIRRPSKTAEIQHQAIFSEAGPEGSLFLPPVSTNSRTSLKFSTPCHSCTKHQQDWTKKTRILPHLHIFAMATTGFRTIPLLSKGSLFQHSPVCTKLPGHNSPSCFVLRDLYLSAQQHTIVLPSNHALCLLPQRHTKSGSHGSAMHNF